jgi:ABC-type spermidine/putrescine transport system permease subunit I
MKSVGELTTGTWNRTRISRYILLLLSLIPLLLFIPTFGLLIWYSLHPWNASTGMQNTLSIQNYTKLISDAYYLGIFLNTIKISVIVTSLALLLGYPLAYGIARTKVGNTLLLIVLLPMFADILVRAYGWIVILGSRGLVNRSLLGIGLIQSPVGFFPSEWAVIVALLHEVMPFMILPIASSVGKIKPSLREAALVLHASEFWAFWTVTLPLSVPGIFAGSLLTLAMCISAFSVPLILGGGRVQMVSMTIAEQMTITLNWPLGGAVSVLLVGIVLGLVYGYGVLTRRIGLAI